MPAPFSAWLHAFRLRTLPLAVSSLVLGSVVLHSSCELRPGAKSKPNNVGDRDTGTVMYAVVGDEKPELKDESINKMDALGRKQGKWILYLRGNPWKIEEYRDGQLHGIRREYWANGEIMEAEYRMGLKHGASTHYHPDSSVAKLYAWYEQGEQQWVVFPWELTTHIVPVKGYSTTRDSTEIRVPYVNGHLLYHGYLKRGEQINDRSYGVHTVYYPNGSTKAIINYDQDSLFVYSTDGRLVEHTTTRLWQGRVLK